MCKQARKGWLYHGSVPIRVHVEWRQIANAVLYHAVADGAERLQVVQKALSSSAVHRLDVIHLPEVAFDWVTDHLVQLSHTHTHNPKINCLRKGLEMRCISSH